MFVGAVLAILALPGIVIGVIPSLLIRFDPWRTDGLAAGYFVVYLTTPLDLALQMHRSLDRLLLQLWPLVLLAVFMVARVPEQRSEARPQS